MYRMLIVINIIVLSSFIACGEESVSSSSPIEGIDAGAYRVPDASVGNTSPTAFPADASRDTGGNSGDSGDTQQSDAGADNKAPTAQCETEGEIRCLENASRQRQQCSDGDWVTMDPCPEGQVCDSEDNTNPGTCQAVFESCIGFQGTGVCVGQVMHKCSADGIDKEQETCKSPRHCQVGVPHNACAVCLPGDFNCVDERLERCADDGRSWELHETCTTAVLCNDIIGDCTNEVCRPDTYACEGDVLMICNDDQTAMVPHEVCDEDLCDEFGAQCDICIPGERTCKNDILFTCEADGQTYRSETCESGTCESGRCLECRDDGDCEASNNSCENVYCNRFGECVYESDCEGNTPYCGEGGCVACLEDEHCEFTSNDASDPNNICVDAQCIDGECALVGKDTSVRCGLLDSWYCDGEGNCVECNENGDCDRSFWREIVCDDHQCVTAECDEDEDCNEGLECRNSRCKQPDVFCGDGDVDEETEECDPFDAAPENGRYYTENDERTLFCTTECKIETLYTPCEGDNDCVDSICLDTVHLCSGTCNPSGPFNSNCPSITTDANPLCSNEYEYGSAFYCILECEGNQDCPLNVDCVIEQGEDTGVCMFEIVDEE